MTFKDEQEHSRPQQVGMAVAGGMGESFWLQNSAVLNGLIAGSQDLIAVQDTSFHYVALNSAYLAEFKKVFGVDLEIGASMAEALARLPEERKSALELWARTLRGEDFTVRREFGDPRLGRKYYEIHCLPIRDSEGRLIGAAHIARDLTEKYRAEEALRQSEEEFRTFFESSSGGKAQADPDTGHFLRVNDTMCELTGYTKEELLGMTLADLLYPEDRERHWGLYCQARDSGAAEYSVEKRYRRKDGSALWVQATVGFLRDETGKAYRSIAVVQDITPLKRIEQELRASEERFRRLVETSNVGVAIADNEGCLRYVNPALLEMLGYEWEDVRSLHCLDFIPPEYADHHEQTIEQILSQGVSEPYEKELIAKDGRRVPVLSGASLIAKDAAGQPLVAYFITDLTRLKQAEAERERLLQAQVLTCEQLENERQKLQTILQHMPAGVIVVDAATSQRMLINEPAARILGAKLEPGSLTGEMQHRLLRPDGRPYAYDEYPIVRSITAGEVVHDEEIQVVRSDGEQRTILTNSVPIRDPEGRIVSGVVIFTDITERKKAELELEQSRQRFQELSAATFEGIAITERGRMVDVNEQFVRMLGYQREELIGMEVAALIVPEERERIVANIFADRESITEHGVVRKDGSVIIVEAHGKPSSYQGRKARITVIRDITERKQVEESLRLRNERLTLLSEAAAHLLKAKDPDTMIQELFNKVSRHLNLQGYMNFMLNETGDALRLDSYAGVPREAAHQVKRLEFGQGVCGTVAQHRRAICASHIQQSEDEKVQLVKELGIRAYNCNPLMAGGRLLGTLAFATSTRDDFDDDELEFMRTVCQYVAMAKERLRLEGELRRHLGQLAEADRRKDEFLAMLAHELRNPLAPIRNAVQVLHQHGANETIRQRQQDIIDRQITHMARLLGDLLDVSRITRGMIELRKQSLPLADVMAHAVEAVAPLAEAKRQQLSIALPPDELRVEADLDRLAQAIGNLLANAVKYTDEGGQVWLAATREGDEAVIRVRDTGVGIDPQMLPRIFDLFAQADHSLGRSQGGLGIGLTMVKSLVEMHGGRVEAFSRGLGQGSQFTIRMPALPDKAPAAPTQPELAPTGARETPSHHILVVDDVVDSSNSLAELLTLWGHEVRIANDGSTALELVRQFRPEVVLLDIGMPGMDGYEVARRLRGEHPDWPMRLVALTGYAQQSDLQRAREAGFDYHLAKPVDLNTLHELL